MRNDVYQIIERDGQRGLRLNWHAGQQRAWNSTARILMVTAGHQSGKTCFGPAWLHRETVRRGEGEYIASSATYKLLMLKMLPELIRYFVVTLGPTEGWTYHRGDMIFTNGDCSKKIFVLSGHKPESLESATAKAAWGDEWGQDQVTIESWEALQRRLAINEGRCLLTHTPYNMGWTKQQVYDRWKGGEAGYEVVNFRSIDNPAYPVAEYERMRATLPAWKFAMFCDGLYTRPAGLIYGDYDDSYAEFEPIIGNDGEPVAGAGVYVGGGHLVRPFTIPAHWLRRVGLDFGASLHNAQVWKARDPETDYWYTYREVAQINKTGPEQAVEAAEYNEPIDFMVGGAPSENDARMEWNKALSHVNAQFGVIAPPISEVEPGIDCSIGLFKQHRSFVFDTCIGLRSEFGTYSRELDDAGEPTQKIKDKAKFHRIDANRYVDTTIVLNAEPDRKEQPLPPDDRTDAAHEARMKAFYGSDEPEEYNFEY